MMQDIDDGLKSLIGVTFGLIKKIKDAHKGEDWSEEQECPVCKGRIFLRHVKMNGHTFGRCSTKDCIGWME